MSYTFPKIEKEVERSGLMSMPNRGEEMYKVIQRRAITVSRGALIGKCTRLNVWEGIRRVELSRVWVTLGESMKRLS